MKFNAKSIIYKDNNKHNQIESNYEIYTDLALEEREKYERNVEIPGVVLEKKHIGKLNMTITKMIIENRHGEEAMGKPQGTYITIESCMFKDAETACQNMGAHDKITENDIIKYIQTTDNEIAEIIAGEIRKVARQLKKGKSEVKIFVVGLGNENATPDALGPSTAKMVEIRENVICLSPGVLAQTGMETFKIIKGIVKEEMPDIVIAIDSLAARNTSRVATTVQITDTGIIPGSGIGNHRMGLNKENLGVPVIAIGVPMVVNSVTIVHDTMEQLLAFFSKYEELNDITKGFSIFNREEKYGFIDEIMSGGMGKMYVTPKDVDDIIDRISGILAKAINMVTV